MTAPWRPAGPMEPGPGREPGRRTQPLDCPNRRSSLYCLATSDAASPPPGPAPGRPAPPPHGYGRAPTQSSARAASVIGARRTDSPRSPGRSLRRDGDRSDGFWARGTAPSHSGTRHSSAVRRDPDGQDRQDRGWARDRAAKAPRAPRTTLQQGESPWRRRAPLPRRRDRFRVAARWRTAETGATVWNRTTDSGLMTSGLSIRPSNGAHTGRRTSWPTLLERSSRSSYGGEVPRSPDARAG